MKKILALLATSILTCNLIPPLIDLDNTKLEMTPDKIELEEESKASTPFSPETIKFVNLINETLEDWIRERGPVTILDLSEGEKNSKNKLISKTEDILLMMYISAHGIMDIPFTYDYKFSDFVLPKYLSPSSTLPGSINVTIGVKHHQDEEFTWTKNFVFEIHLETILQKNLLPGIVIGTPYNAAGYSNGLSYNNKLYFANKNNMIQFDQQTSSNSVPIILDSDIVTNGVVYNNHIYFGTNDNSVYKYNPKNNDVIKVFKTKENITSDGIVYNDKFYLGTSNGNLYEYDSDQKEAKIILTATAAIKKSGTVFDNKLIFIAENGIVYTYDLKTNHTKETKFNNSDLAGPDSGVIINDKLYFTGWSSISKTFYILQVPKQGKMLLGHYKSIVNKGGSLMA